MSPTLQVQKPFSWVSLESEPKRGKPTGHDRWSQDYTGILECTLKLLTPIHIGSGLFRFSSGGQIVKEFIRHRGDPIIPGSSLKGAFRSIAEAISLSCLSKTKIKMSSHGECRDPQKMCICCRLFGGLGYLGRVRFRDATMSSNADLQIEKVPRLWAPRREQKGRKFYRHGKPAKGKEPYEVFLPNAQFDFKVDVENVTKAEMNLLLTSMGILGGLTPKLGGGKPRCMGSVKVQLKHAKFRVPKEDGTNYEIEWKNLDDKELLAQVTKSNDLIHTKALNDLKEILTYHENHEKEECPADLY